jgi:hypothetical protein
VRYALPEWLASDARSGQYAFRVVGIPELIILLMMLAVPALGIWAAVDAGTKPRLAFERAGQSQTLWIALPLVGIFICGLSIVAAIVWFAAIRPKVVAAQV